MVGNGTVYRLRPLREVAPGDGEAGEMASKAMKKKVRKAKQKFKKSPALRAVAFLVPLGLLIGLYFWFNGTRDATGETQKAVCVVMIDRTDSAGDNPLEPLAEGTIDGCEREDARYFVVYFNQDSSGMRELDGEAQDGFELWEPLKKSGAARKKALDDARDGANAALADVFDIPAGSNRNSDILTAMKDAADLLQSQGELDGVAELHLIIVSDAMQRDPSLDILSLERDDTPAGLVAKAADLGLLPNLEGISVSFAGASSGVSGDGVTLSKEFEASIAEFWNLLVTDAGGQLCAYGPNPEVPPVSCGGN